MLAPYRVLLALPGTRAFVLAGFVGRFPLSMLSLGAILLITGEGGSYGLAGAVAAVMALFTALAAPVVGRLSDTLGQSRVVGPMLALHVAGVSALALVISVGAPAVTFFVPAAAAGLSVPQLGAMVRTRWATTLAAPEGRHRLGTALSLESALDEAVFVIGPVVVTVLSTTIWPATGMLVSLALAVVGGAAFLVLRETEPAVRPRTDESGPAAHQVPGLQVLVVTFVAIGMIFGSVDIAMVGFASDHGHRSASGIILATFALGSLIAGFGYGVIRWRAPLHERFLRAVVCLMLGTIPIALAPNIATMAVAVLLCGLAISPTIVAGMGLVESLVPPAAITEGFAWVSMALGVGFSIGSAFAGRLIDMVGGHHTMLVGVGAAILAAGIAMLTRRSLTVPAAHSLTPETAAG